MNRAEGTWGKGWGGERAREGAACGGQEPGKPPPQHLPAAATTRLKCHQQRKHRSFGVQRHKSPIKVKISWREITPSVIIHLTHQRRKWAEGGGSMGEPAVCLMLEATRDSGAKWLVRVTRPMGGGLNPSQAQLGFEPRSQASSSI